MTSKTKALAIIIGCLALPLTTTFAVDEAATYQWDRAILDILDAGNATNGEKLAKKAKCSKCHGDTGISDEDDTPSVAGQVRGYTFKALVDYKRHIRDDKSMFKKVKKLSLQDMADIAAWYELQKPEAMAGSVDDQPELVTAGDEKRLLLSCAVCHGDAGKGKNFEVPAIAGQKVEYFTDTMMAFKEGDRVNDLYGRMRFIAERLTEEEIEALAEYYATPAGEDDDEDEDEDDDEGKDDE
jgi:cytochrome c553